MGWDILSRSAFHALSLQEEVENAMVQEEKTTAHPVDDSFHYTQEKPEVFVFFFFFNLSSKVLSAAKLSTAVFLVARSRGK